MQEARTCDRDCANGPELVDVSSEWENTDRANQVLAVRRTMNHKTKEKAGALAECRPCAALQLDHPAAAISCSQGLCIPLAPLIRCV